MVEQKRESFRVEYPKAYSPKITIKDCVFDVFDVSEFGIKFYVIDEHLFQRNELVSASINFSDNDEYEIEASIVRIEKGFISLKLITPLPLSKIRAEHLFLIQQYSEKKAYL